jgi:biopolymer transport protein ExbD
MARRRRRQSEVDGEVGFQIAPMIDVVFVILVFFMALAGQIRMEQVLRSRLPGVARAGTPTTFVDEQIVRIDGEGRVYLNEDPLAGAGDRQFGALRPVLMRLRQSSDAARSDLVVTIASDPRSTYQRTVDVLDMLSGLGISRVTFTAEADDAVP